MTVQGKRRITRRRRTAEEAKEQILDAAERRLASGGPEAIRLVEIAAEVGVSHPTVLHHFGSREALVESLAERAMRGLTRDLLQAVRAPDVVQSGPAILERVYRTLGEKGHARLLVWRVLAGWTDEKRSSEAQLLHEIVDVVHERRGEILRGLGRRAPDREDTAFATLFAAFATVGEAVLGPLLLAGVLGRAAGGRKRYLAWVSEQVLELFLRDPSAATDRSARPSSP